jgi:hypothetical protein
MIKLGLPLTVVMYVLILASMFLYWPFVGLWK